MAVSFQSLLLFPFYFSHISTRVYLPVKWLWLVVVDRDVTNFASNTVRMMTPQIEFFVMANIVVFWQMKPNKYFGSNHNIDNNIGRSMTLD